jgi:hypothetical protein
MGKRGRPRDPELVRFVEELLAMEPHDVLQWRATSKRGPLALTWACYREMRIMKDRQYRCICGADRIYVIRMK